MAEHGSMTAPVGPGAENKRALHFGSLAAQSHAAKLGMWLFLGTEVLLFGGLFVGFAYYKAQFPETWVDASHHLAKTIGTINTLVLVLSSLAVALSSYFTHHDRKKVAVVMLCIAIALGLVFLGLKAVEWKQHFDEKAYPGKFYAFSEVPGPGASMFYSLYFLMTGLHALHVTIGVLVLGWLAVLAWRGAFSSLYDTPLELGTMYWHFVDVVWIFLFPLLYLL